MAVMASIVVARHSSKGADCRAYGRSPTPWTGLSAILPSESPSFAFSRRPPTTIAAKFTGARDPPARAVRVARKQPPLIHPKAPQRSLLLCRSQKDCPRMYRGSPEGGRATQGPGISLPRNVSRVFWRPTSGCCLANWKTLGGPGLEGTRARKEELGKPRRREAEPPWSDSFGPRRPVPHLAGVGISAPVPLSAASCFSSASKRLSDI
ncbi:hypothetical protein BDK51DRAFT_43858 [Blyttiomyces helicus]|uniref:Uncharacterized protein n=1 Tax=Blyttiomyces helicus TaxID=388810 RepID=A0A4P9WNY6_9FUNG|nr:hypothetical protein BDK51DRAFT_43858 [Blyttiomyces helicus]|eukprot:RKO92920.1 hypothetical protein BDK51DRAFT_43858 [Blyttiomyces helicus]